MNEKPALTMLAGGRALVWPPVPCSVCNRAAAFVVAVGEVVVCIHCHPDQEKKP